jgi:hypothetical protein
MANLVKQFPKNPLQLPFYFSRQVAKLDFSLPKFLDKNCEILDIIKLERKNPPIFYYMIFLLRSFHFFYLCGG